MTGLELLKAPEATAGEIADIISAPCPPTIPAHCDGVSCRECWLTWLTGEPIKEKEPPDKRTAPDEEGLHPNLVAFLRQRKHLLGVLEDVKDDVTSANKITAAHVLKPCYMEDDHTVTALATGASVAGTVIRVDDEGVAVECGGYVPAAAAAGVGG